MHHGGAHIDGTYLTPERIAQIQNTVQVLESKGAVQIECAILQSGLVQSLILLRNLLVGQLREVSSLVLLGMVRFLPNAVSRCSPNAVLCLHDQWGVSALLSATGEEGMGKSSALRRKVSPRCLGLLDAAGVVVTRA